MIWRFLCTRSNQSYPCRAEAHKYQHVAVCCAAGQITDLQIAGTARVTLDPLVPVIPGFGAAVIALRCARVPAC